MLIRLHIKHRLYILLALFVMGNAVLWLSVRQTRGIWLNVPPVPPAGHTAAAGLGDAQLAFRTMAMSIQNLGGTDGRTVPLRDYDYEKLSRWFLLLDKLDHQSNFIPFIAAYYFGAVDDPEKLPPLVDFLAEIGNKPGGEKWRWLLQAVFLARWRMQDMDRALELAKELVATYRPGMPIWVKQMPAFVLNAKGDKQEALDLMIEMLRSNVDTMHPNEINATRDYICTRLLTATESKNHPLCKDLQ